MIKNIEENKILNDSHALEILHEASFTEWTMLQEFLRGAQITTEDLLASGGNETNIPKKFDDFLYPRGWREIKITGDLLVKMFPRGQSRGHFSKEPFQEKIIKGVIDGHNIDFVTGKVAFDLELNSKDQTFDRDLLAMRTYFDCGLI